MHGRRDASKVRGNLLMLKVRVSRHLHLS